MRLKVYRHRQRSLAELVSRFWVFCGCYAFQDFYAYYPSWERAYHIIIVISIRITLSSILITFFLLIIQTVPTGLLNIPQSACDKKKKQ